MKKTERDLRRELHDETPDFWDRISHAVPRETEARAITDKGTTVKRRTLAAILPAVIALITAVILVLCFLLPAAPKPFSISFGNGGAITVDINPGVQLNLDENGKVKSVIPLNDDGRLLIAGKTDLIGISGEKAATKVLSYALETGYISPARTNNALLVSTALADKRSADAYTDAVKCTLKAEFEKLGVFGVVLSQANDGSTVRADAYGISVAKMKLIDNAIALGATVLESEYATITVSELNARIEERAEYLEEVPTDFEEQLEALLEQSEELCENLTDRIEELIESIEELLEDETENDDEMLETLLDAIEDALGALETQAGTNALNRIADMSDRLTAYAPDSLKPKIQAVVNDVKAELNEYSILNAQIEAQKSALLDKRQALADKYSAILDSYEKPPTFDDDFDDWYDDACNDFSKNWSDYYSDWLNSLDRDD